MRRRLPALVIALALVGGACDGGSGATPDPDATLPLPEATDTLLPVVSDTAAVDTTAPLPADALFGGDICAALEDAELAPLGVTDLRGRPLSIDTCTWEARDGLIVVQLATPEEFNSPGGGGLEIAPVEGVGIRALGVSFGVTYAVFVKVENGYFSVTAPTRAVAERLAAAAAPRATRPVGPPTIPVTDPAPTDVPSTEGGPSTTARPSTGTSVAGATSTSVRSTTTTVKTTTTSSAAPTTLAPTTTTTG